MAVDEADEWDSIISSIARRIYKGTLKPEDLDKRLLNKTAKELLDATFSGYGKSLDQIDYTSPDYETLRQLQVNVHIFSGAKTYQQLRECTDRLLDEEGKIRSFTDFRNEVFKVHEDYNVNYLRSERNHAISSAQMAARWQGYVQQKEIFANLTFRTVGDDRVRRKHQLLDGVTRPVDDTFWRTNYPPLDWGCRCDVDQSNGEVTELSEISIPTIPRMFRGNVGIDGVIFPESHPYYKMDKAAREEVYKKTLEALPSTYEYERVYEAENGGWVDLHHSHRKDELVENVRVAKLLADGGHKVSLLEYVHKAKTKNPDAQVNGLIADFKKVKSARQGKVHKALQNLVESANRQLADVAIIEVDYPLITADDIYRSAIGATLEKRNRHIKQIWYINSAGEVLKLEREQIQTKKWREELDGFL